MYKDGNLEHISIPLEEVMENRITEHIIHERQQAIDHLFWDFIYTLNPPLELPATPAVIKKRGIERVIQEDKTWFTTHGSRASKILDISIHFKYEEWK